MKRLLTLVVILTFTFYLSSVYSIGYFQRTADYKPGTGVINLSIADSCNNTSSTITVSGCNTYIAPDGVVYTFSGIETAIIPNAAGCDSIITINLTIIDGQIMSDMVHVVGTGGGGPVDYWIDKYEASLAYDSTGPAVSVAGVLPQINITQVEATNACIWAGKRLCNDTEWLTACQGFGGLTYPYGNTEVPGACNGGAYDSTAVLLPTGSMGSCVSSEGIFDMYGNAGEWTADPDGTFRGGSYTEAVMNGPGCLYTTTAHTIYYHDVKTGFRCCSDSPPNVIDICPAMDMDGDGYTPNQGDCNDSNPNVYPWAIEICNGLDDDCDGYTDDSLMSYSFNESQSICSGDSLLWQGVYRKNAGIYHANYTTVLGCDSIYELNLTVNTVDISITITDSTLTANATADSYQWLDCDNVYAPIGGATFQSYTATANGNYAVIITQGLCSDTSACVQIVTVGIASKNLPCIALYPNPSGGLFTLELDESASIEIYNALGELIYSASLEKGKHTFSLNLADGIYLLKATNDKGSKSLRMVIQK
jgi:hypothetical protein